MQCAPHVYLKGISSKLHVERIISRFLKGYKDQHNNNICSAYQKNSLLSCLLLQRHGLYRIAHIALYTDDNLARSPAIATAVRRSQRGSYLHSSAYIHTLFLRYVVLSISNHNYQDSDRKRRSVQYCATLGKNTVSSSKLTF